MNSSDSENIYNQIEKYKIISIDKSNKNNNDTNDNSNKKVSKINQKSCKCDRLIKEININNSEKSKSIQYITLSTKNIIFNENSLKSKLNNKQKNNCKSKHQEINKSKMYYSNQDINQGLKSYTEFFYDNNNNKIIYNPSSMPLNQNIYKSYFRKNFHL
ncbi:hypothetical protein U3516DRAFT_824504, partial [Neocallimastix sp. 'constans']